MQALFVVLGGTLLMCGSTPDEWTGVPEAWARYIFTGGMLFATCTIGFMFAAALYESDEEEATPEVDEEEAKWRKLLDGKTDDRYGLGRLR